MTRWTFGRRSLLAAVLVAGGVLSAPMAGASGVPGGVEGVEGYAPHLRAESVAALAADHGVGTAEAARRLAAQAGQTALAQRLAERLGQRSPGSYIDRTSGDLVVTVTDEAAADVVRASGAVARVVPHGSAELAAVQRRVERTMPVGAAVGIDPVANKVVLTLPPGASGAAGAGDLLEVRRGPGVAPAAQIVGGDRINMSGGGYCSAGFNATGGLVVTAGHCTAATRSWTSQGRQLGTSYHARFPGNDYGSIRLASGWTQVGAVRAGGGYQRITGASNSVVGAQLCKSGATTGYTCGRVTQVNTSVRYQEGVIRPVTEATTCLQPGDSGGAAFAGSSGQGIDSGATIGGCSQAGFRSYYQPLTNALNAMGLRLY